MTQYDPQKTARVWQRVQAGSGETFLPDIRQDRSLPELIAGELEDAADFQRLARRYTGPERNRLLQMAKQEQLHAAFLRRLLSSPRQRK